MGEIEATVICHGAWCDPSPSLLIPLGELIRQIIKERGGLAVPTTLQSQHPNLTWADYACNTFAELFDLPAISASLLLHTMPGGHQCVQLRSHVSKPAARPIPVTTQQVKPDLNAVRVAIRAHLELCTGRQSGHIDRILCTIPAFSYAAFACTSLRDLLQLPLLYSEFQLVRKPVGYEVVMFRETPVPSVSPPPPPAIDQIVHVSANGRANTVIVSVLQSEGHSFPPAAAPSPPSVRPINPQTLEAARKAQQEEECKRKEDLARVTIAREKAEQRATYLTEEGNRRRQALAEAEREAKEATLRADELRAEEDNIWQQVLEDDKWRAKEEEEKKRRIAQLTETREAAAAAATATVSSPSIPVAANISPLTTLSLDWLAAPWDAVGNAILLIIADASACVELCYLGVMLSTKLKGFSLKKLQCSSMVKLMEQARLKRLFEVYTDSQGKTMVRRRSQGVPASPAASPQAARTVSSPTIGSPTVGIETPDPVVSSSYSSIASGGPALPAWSRTLQCEVVASPGIFPSALSCFFEMCLYAEANGFANFHSMLRCDPRHCMIRCIAGTAGHVYQWVLYPLGTPVEHLPSEYAACPAALTSSEAKNIAQEFFSAECIAALCRFVAANPGCSPVKLLHGGKIGAPEFQRAAALGFNVHDLLRCRSDILAYKLCDRRFHIYPAAPSVALSPAPSVVAPPETATAVLVTPPAAATTHRADLRPANPPQASEAILDVDAKLLMFLAVPLVHTPEVWIPKANLPALPVMDNFASQLLFLMRPVFELAPPQSREARKGAADHLPSPFHEFDSDLNEFAVVAPNSTDGNAHRQFRKKAQKQEVAKSELNERIDGAYSDDERFFVEKNLVEEGLRHPSLLNVTALVLWAVSLPRIEHALYTPMPLLLYVIERLLRDLVRRECDLRTVTFVEDVQHLPPYHMVVHDYACRHLAFLAQHLNLRHLTPVAFASVKCREFQSYVRDLLPSIAFSFSGENMPEQSRLNLHLYAARCWAYSCAVTYLEDIKVSGSAIRGHLHRFAWRNPDLLRELENSVAGTATQQQNLRTSTTPREMLQEALRTLLTSSPSELLWQLFARAVVLSLCVQSHLDIHERALQQPRKFKSSGLIEFLDQVYLECHAVPLGIGSEAYVELFDVTLLLHLLLHAAARLPKPLVVGTITIPQLLELSPELDGECVRFWAAIAPSKWAEPLVAVQLDWLKSLGSFKPQAPRVDAPVDSNKPYLCTQCKPSVSASSAISTNLLLFPIHSPVLSAALPQFDVPHYSPLAAPVRAVQQQYVRFSERYHWHSTALLTPNRTRPLDPYWQRKQDAFHERMKGYSMALVNTRRARFIGKGTAVSTPLPSAGAAVELAAELAELNSCTEVAELLQKGARLRGLILQDAPGLMQLLAQLVKFQMPDQTESLETRIAVDLSMLSTGSLAVDPLRQLHTCGEYQRWREAAMPAETRETYLTDLGFVPDPWQLQVISAIERRSSVVLSAPTSSGKTFISFYVIESILKRDPTASIAFVLPTKALVNQVYAEVLGSFRVPSNHPYTLVGLFTADNRINENDCSVLVTVPQALEILFLSPEKSSVLRRLQYVILDEAHSIADTDGEVWEHLLALTSCPFIALSATMSNMDKFVSWTQSLRPTQVVEAITHSERSSYQCLLAFPCLSIEDAQLQLEEEEACKKAGRPQPLPAPLHLSAPRNFVGISAIALNTHLTLKHGILREWRSLPSQLVELFAAFENAFAPLPPVDPLCSELMHTLPPTARYVLLSCLCLKGANHPLPREPGDLRTLLFEGLKDDIDLAQLEELRGYLVDLDFNISSLLALLHPSRFFEGVTEVCKNEVTLYDLLLRRFCVTAARDARIFSAFASLCPKLSHFYRPRDLKQHVSRLVQALHEEDMLPAICFAFDREMCDEFCKAVAEEYPLPSPNNADVIEQAVRGLLAVAKFPMEWQMNALRAGYAVHHAGCTDEFKMEVERLFRLRLLRVIFATGTLALGIHMPCRTVIFAGASPYLTPTSLRQIAGRAGRRGFDAIGNVVLFGLGIPAMRSLLLGLQAIHGSLPVSCTYLLRLLMHVDGRRSGSEFSAVVRQLKQPLFTFGDSSSIYAEQLKHHVRFSLEFLLREGHLDSNGRPLQWSGLLAHLHYTEPSNFIVLRWLRKGLLHQVASEQNIEKRRTMFVRLFSSIFLLERGRPEKGTVLPPLPEEFLTEVKQHNAEVLLLYVAYLKAVIRSSTLATTQERFPLSGVSLQCDGKLSQAEPLAAHLACIRLERSEIRSHFYCLLGIAEHYPDAEDLVATARSDLLLDLSLLPVVNLPRVLNNHLLAYYQHRQLERIQIHNHISPGDYFRFSDAFLKVIKKIWSSVSLQSRSGDHLRAALSDLKEAYERCCTELPSPYGPWPPPPTREHFTHKHTLFWVVPREYEGGAWQCDLCKVEDHSHVWHCMRCSYDVCATCIMTEPPPAVACAPSTLP